MKKFLIYALISCLPLLSVAQKRGKKSKNQTQAKTYMLMKVFESKFSIDPEAKDFIENKMDSDESSKFVDEIMINSFLKNESLIKVKFELSEKISKQEYSELNQIQNKATTITEAINNVAKFGWNLSHADSYLLETKDIIHYFYLVR
tara:strand:+ start:136 stop:576 length:441 start_codon:yes stop_codon:yes gene_type:complete